MRAIDAVAQRLVQKAVGTLGTSGTIFVGNDADLPVLPSDKVLITVIHTGGSPPQRLHTVDGGVRFPHFQITARHLRYPNAEDGAERAWLALGGDNQDRMVNVRISDVLFLWCRPMQDPFGMPPDANGRARVTFNIETAWRR